MLIHRSTTLVLSRCHNWDSATPTYIPGPISRVRSLAQVTGLPGHRSYSKAREEKPRLVGQRCLGLTLSFRYVLFVEVRRALLGPGLWPGPRRPARWGGRGLRGQGWALAPIALATRPEGAPLTPEGRPGQCAAFRPDEL